MTQYSTVFADLTRAVSRSDFEKAVKARHADKGVKTLPTYDMFKQSLYGQLTGCFSRVFVKITRIKNRIV